VGPSGQSLTGMDKPALEEAVVEAASDESAVGAAQRALAGTAAVLPLYEPSTAMGWLDVVTGVQPNPSADGPLWNAQEWSKPGV
jgi:hypothetical protein